MFNMRMKPVNIFKICEFITYVKDLLHVSATFCGHLQGGVAQIILYVFYILIYFKP